MTYVGPTDGASPEIAPNRGFMGFFIGAVVGLIIGAIGGAYCMYVATMGTMPVAIDAVARGMAINDMEQSGPVAPAPAAPPAEQPAP
jgi:CDP-diglyceride synthetase